MESADVLWSNKITYLWKKYESAWGWNKNERKFVVFFVAPHKNFTGARPIKPFSDSVTQYY